MSSDCADRNIVYRIERMFRSLGGFGHLGPSGDRDRRCRGRVDVPAVPRLPGPSERARLSGMRWRARPVLRRWWARA